ncbi:MAG TPA: LytTR family DNA-binding domain-containing protein [Gemmatimonadaceae bacterium]|nr:LytTR family DNA-binding domain-containing protein [Gemmatimonadaceae bacterium]
MTVRPELLRVVVADDESLARRMLTMLLARERDVVVVAESDNGPATIDAVRAHAPDVLFLDVRMPGATGIEVLEQLGPGAVRAAVLVTAFDDYAVAAFDHHALDYVLKPVDEDRFRTTMQRVRDRLREHRSATLAEETLKDLARLYASAGTESRVEYLSRIVVRSTRSVTFVDVADVDWVEADDDYLRLHVGTRVHLVRDTMGALETQLDPAEFVRIHRSTIVRIRRVKELVPYFHGDYEVRLIDGTRLRLSRSYRARLGAALGTML